MNEKQRRQIVWEAARLLHTHQEEDVERAKMRVARQICHGPLRRGELPTNREIREELQRMLVADDESPHPAATVAATDLDRYHYFAILLRPLEEVKQDPARHPEGDVLYHSLQVFELARDRLPYDEEFLLAALLHDVGKAIDRRNHVAAGLQALVGFISPRTAWLIEHHSEANQLRQGTIGARLRRRLEADENFDELMLLSECDREGRCQGVDVPEVEEALEYIRGLADEHGE
ncbi:MAG: HD domain-containing protein [Planctomycetota bacterium]|nr:MAG: HD domain-containing protein [Planctomycetota bacterium]REJ67412.1 MAG: HD domain-containing protein [Planctomycetota bacterium]REJ89304.1 MAG: HD domain-containing protein [Planctomycetota bacterium]